MITGAGGSAATNVIDSLLMADSSIKVIACDSSSYMLSLAKGDERYRLPHASSQNYLSELQNLILKTSPDVLQAQPDIEVTTIVNSEIPSLVGTFFPDRQTIALCSDKSLLNFALRNHEVAIPEAISLDEESYFEQLRNFIDINGKSWVRAKVGAGSRASLPVTKVSQASNWISWWREEKGFAVDNFMISEFLPGKEFAVQVIFQDGVLIAAEARERVEYLFGFMTPSGQSSSPSVARTTKRKDIYDLGLAAVSAVMKKPHGVFGIDIKEDKLGIPKVTEINAGRFYTTSHFLARAGVNMPDMAFKAAQGEKLKPLGIGILEEGLLWIRMMDMGCCLQNKDGEILWRSK